MVAKTGEARRRAFFAALAESGNQTLAAERAKVSRSWVTLHRASDPDFRAALDAAIATAKTRLRAAGGVAPDAGWRTHAGEELSVRGTNGRRVQIARARLNQWTRRIEKRFLDALAGCCSVKLACAAAGMSIQSAYGHRHRWSCFARRWDQALEYGYVMLESAMLAKAGQMLDPDRRLHEVEPEPPIGPISCADALQLLRLHQYCVHRVGNPLRQPGPLRNDEDVGAVIIRKVEMVKRVRAHEARVAAEKTGRRRGRVDDTSAVAPVSARSPRPV